MESRSNLSKNDVMTLSHLLNNIQLTLCENIMGNMTLNIDQVYVVLWGYDLPDLEEEGLAILGLKLGPVHSVLEGHSHL